MFKLIRDKIPSLMKEEGKVCNYAAVQNDELYYELLRGKLIEEVNEFLSDGTVEELVDIMTVIKSLYTALGINEKSFEEFYKDKLEKQGSFDNKYMIFLPDQSQVLPEEENK